MLGNRIGLGVTAITGGWRRRFAAGGAALNQWKAARTTTHGLPPDAPAHARGSPLAVPQRSWSSEFGYGLGESKLRLQFGLARIMDYAEHADALEQSPSPAAVIVLAHVRSRQTMGNPAQRFLNKVKLVKSLGRKMLAKEFFWRILGLLVEHGMQRCCRLVVENRGKPVMRFPSQHPTPTITVTV